MSFFLSALQKLSSFEVSILSTAEPVTGIVLAMLFLGEKMQPLQVLGASMILGAMFLAAKVPKQIPEENIAKMQQ